MTVRIRFFGGAVRCCTTFLIGLKNKLCKCNKQQNSDNTKNATKKGNAEERPDAGCGIKRRKTAAEKMPLFFLSSDIPKRINLRGLGTESPTAVRLQTVPQSKP